MLTGQHQVKVKLEAASRLNPITANVKVIKVSFKMTEKYAHEKGEPLLALFINLEDGIVS
jgi:hypothetical protein